jgi:ABC-type multidrug transport system ATPase subunit
MSELLKMTSLSKSFGRHLVFSGLNIKLDAGKVYGLLGLNGEGKTTLIRILLGVIPADTGSIHYKGSAVTFRSAAYKGEVGYIPEDSFFYGGMRVGELLDFNSVFYRRWDVRRAAELLKRFSLDRKARIKTLSRGMKLRLEMAVALAARPALLVLDDPTSGLDVPTRYDFLQDIIRELADSGTTILFSTHLVHELERIVDHLFILHRGRLILDQDHEAVKNSIRRVRLAFQGDPPETLGVDGVLVETRDGPRQEIVVYPWTDEKKEKLDGFSPALLQVEPLTLEEIFRSFVAG